MGRCVGLGVLVVGCFGGALQGGGLGVAHPGGRGPCRTPPGAVPRDPGGAPISLVPRLPAAVPSVCLKPTCFSQEAHFC